MPHTMSQKSMSQKLTSQKSQAAYKDYRNQHRHREDVPRTTLTRLIEQDAPLFSHSQLVLMYGFFQAEMAPEANQGVASWIKDCIRQYGLPSLVRFDSHRRAQIFRRDQFQPWLEPLMDQAC